MKSRSGKFKPGFIVIAVLLGAAVFRAYTASAQDAAWRMSIKILLDGRESSVLEFGGKPSATDSYDKGIDYLAPPASMEEDEVYFVSASRQPAPYNRLLKDYRALDDRNSVWKMEIKIPAGRKAKAAWDRNTLPAGLRLTCQEANSAWNGLGPEFTLEQETFLEVSNDTGEPIVKRFLIRAAY